MQAVPEEIQFVAPQFRSSFLLQCGDFAKNVKLPVSIEPSNAGVGSKLTRDLKGR